MSEYQLGTRVWFPDKDEGWIGAEVTSRQEQGDDLVLTFVDDRHKEITITTTAAKAGSAESELPPLRNPPLLEGTDDLTNLSYLNEPAVLYSIRNRYAQHSIYTYSGIVLIAMNPFAKLSLYGTEIIQAYSTRRRGELEPHLFAIAQDAYSAMVRDNRNQTIVVSGESGAGKTVSARHIMRYFATVEDPSRAPRRRGKEASGMTETETQILATNPILEGFGNAKTTRNDNSSRFGKYLEILFDKDQAIIGAKIRIYLLERSRLIYQPETERNYHIFYQLCAGAPPKERAELGLADSTEFYYLAQGGTPTIKDVDDADEFAATCRALSTLGITVERQWHIFKLLAALLHLGNIQIGQTRTDAVLADDEPSLVLACRFLGIPPAEFKKWTVKKQITTRSEKIVSSLNAAQAGVVRDSVAKWIYAGLFDWLVAVLNEGLLKDEVRESYKSFIGVLDIYGFEHFKKNSFEQFCINYANEKLQQEFNAHVFKLEQDEYVAEAIEWTFIKFSDNRPTIDMIEGKLGILSLLDEESRLPSGADSSFLQKLHNTLGKPEYKDIFKKPRFGNTAFTVAHYALDVTYEAEGFLEKNRDTVPDEHLALLGNSTNDFLREVIDRAVAVNATPEKPATTAGAPGRRAVAKKPTLGSIFKSSLIDLMTTINDTNAHYIRCIKPNEAKRAWEFEPQQVLGQLRACGVLETIRISCAGYPSRWTFAEFTERYYLLVGSEHWAGDLRELCTRILEATITDVDKYQIGLTKIFFRAGMLAFLEKLRSDRLNSLVTLIQKNISRYVQQKRYRLLRAASIRIQTWWRAVLARRVVEDLRRHAAALKVQTAARRWVVRHQFLDTRRAVVAIQSQVRGRQARLAFAEFKYRASAVKIQSYIRGALARSAYRANVKGVIHLQACYRRRLARKELKTLRTEARSVNHFKEVSYKLENKVVQLTQDLQRRTAERKEAQGRVAALEKQLAAWQTKHEEADGKIRDLQAELAKPTVPLPQFTALEESKRESDQRLEESIRKISEQDSQIAKLADDLARKSKEVDEKAAAVAEAVSKAADEGTMTRLRTEIASLRDQLNRANALNALERNNSRAQAPPSPTFSMHLGRNNGITADQPQALALPASKRRPRRHSSAGMFAEQTNGVRDSTDERLFAGKRSEAVPRAVSVAYPSDMNNRLKGVNGRAYLPEVYDDPAEEMVKLLEDEVRLDEDVLGSLIRNLKFPSPSLQNPPSSKEVLFPAHIISLVTNEMWKYSMIGESERFLANVMQTIQQHVMSHTGEDAIVPGLFWLSNVHEIWSFVCVTEDDMLQGIVPGGDDPDRPMDWPAYEHLIGVVKHDLESLEFNIYFSFMEETKKKLRKMIVPALIESQSLPGFITADGGGRLFNRLLQGNSTPAFSMDDILNLLNKVWKSLKSYRVEETVVQQVMTELLRLIGNVGFNDLLMRRNFNSWKRAMQIQYNLTRIEEWCKSHDMPEGCLHLEYIMQATKLLQLKKATQADMDIIFDVCWILSPSQLHKLITGYMIADYESPLSPHILQTVSARVSGDRNDHLLLPEHEDGSNFEIPQPRPIAGLDLYLPGTVNVPQLRRVAALAA